MKHLFYIVTIFFMSCSEEKTKETNYIVKSDGSIVYKSEGIELTLLEEGERGNVKNFEGVSFVVKDVSALDYLQRTQRNVSSADREELKRESVFMLELVGHKPSGSIFGNNEIQMSEEDATKYLVGEVESDFVVIQNEKRFKPNGVQYDGRIGTGQKIRVTFFMEGVNLKLPYTIEYYDRLFGKGLVKLTKKKTNLISLQ